jgi:hypothetical protein
MNPRNQREVKKHGATAQRGRWRRRVKRDVTPDMNVTPLVDVLVLLIIFMVVTPALRRDVQLDLPGIFNPDPQTEEIRSGVGREGGRVPHGRPEVRPRGRRPAWKCIIDPARRCSCAPIRLPYRGVRGIMARVQRSASGLSFGVGEASRRRANRSRVARGRGRTGGSPAPSGDAPAPAAAG